MPNFRTAFTERIRCQCDVSNKIEPVYQLVDGQPQQVGTRNVYDEIQQDADMCDINILLRKYQSGNLILGTPDLESPVLDLTEIPTDLVTSSMAIQKAKASWDSLPDNIKSLFNNNIEEFAATTPTELTSKLATLFVKEESKVDEKKEDTK